MVPLRSNLARFMPVEPMDADAIEAHRRRAWREAGMVTVRPDELRSEWLARGIEAWANERFGPRVSRETRGRG